MKIYKPVAALLMAAAAMTAVASGPRLVLLHTNDTHSQIDPDDKGRGGILRRKVLVDSVRAERPNVLLIDAGDAVQGTLYFSLYGGEVERKMMNALGYDIQILGNHEFDNGIEGIRREWSQLGADRITTNYDLSATVLDSLFVPYVIKAFDGRRVAFIAINLDPDGMIGHHNSQGVVYLDGIKAANATAWHLKHNERVDGVVAITHVGYDTDVPPTPSDLTLARNTENIDIIIGGHSHTVIDPSSSGSPQWLVPNLAGDTVLVAQTGSRGFSLGEIDIDLSTMKGTSRLIPVDARLDSRVDSEAAAILAPYRHGVDSLMAVKIGRLAEEMPHGGAAQLNWASDVVRQLGERLAGRKIDVALMNRGGLRRGLPEGDITKGMIMTMMPFDNHVVVLEIKGSDLIGAFKVMSRKRGGDGVSEGFDYKSIDPDRTYVVATIDYLADGGDYMTPLTRATVVARSPQVLYDDFIQYVEGLKMRPIKASSRPRMPECE